MPEPHDIPTVTELLEAVAEFLENEVIPASEERLRFRTRVASNAVGIVLRELTLGREQSEAHRSRLTQLGYESDAALAEAIRSGRATQQYAEIVGILHDVVRDKLMVANPKYLGRSSD